MRSRSVPFRGGVMWLTLVNFGGIRRRDARRAYPCSPGPASCGNRPIPSNFLSARVSKGSKEKPVGPGRRALFVPLQLPLSPGPRRVRCWASRYALISSLHKFGGENGDQTEGA
jgi:hypothetical protein